MQLVSSVVLDYVCHIVCVNLGPKFAVSCVEQTQQNRYGWRRRTLLTARLGLPDIPYFTGALVFRPQSSTSRDEATRETKSPAFQLGPVSHQSPHTVAHCVMYYIIQHTVLLQTLRRVVPQTSVVSHIEH